MVKAMAMGYENGFVKTIIQKDTGEFLGVHMVGMGVTELIHNYALAKGGRNYKAKILKILFSLILHYQRLFMKVF